MAISRIAASVQNVPVTAKRHPPCDDGHDKTGDHGDGDDHHDHDHADQVADEAADEVTAGNRRQYPADTSRSTPLRL